MIYSCFDPQTGLYDYHQDDRTIPINGDLPVPRLPHATQLGVASIEAGRPLPSGARPVGRGWHAKGQVVQCGRGNGMGAFDAEGAWSWFTGGGWAWVAGGFAAVWVLQRGRIL